MAEFVEVEDGGITWRLDADFANSTWHCIWGAGCPGIEDEPAPDAQLGCCSVGAQMADADEAMNISALAAMIPDHLFEHSGSRIFRDDEHTLTELVDGACVFLNRPGFEGGAGCALHLAAVDAGESPIDWKPAVCWQLPLRVDTAGTTVTIRRWTRTDWGEGGKTMVAMCTDPSEVPAAFDSPLPVVETLSDELTQLMGEDVVARVRAKLRS